MDALLLVDIQNDFCPGGALEVPRGDEVVEVANHLIPQFELVVASQDWHPANHGSFAANHPWRKPGQVIDLHGLEQVLWPMHCVQDSMGAEFHPQLHSDQIGRVFQKGTDPAIDSYSAFYDNGHRKSTGLSAYLRDKSVNRLFVMGLALDYCVKFTALDARSEGFDTYLIQDGCRAIKLEAGDGQKAIDELVDAGVNMTHSAEVGRQLHNN